MASVIGVLALAAGVFWLEAPGLIRRKRIRELIWLLAFLGAGTALYAALTLEVRLPNPFEIIPWMFGWLR
ncbi:hypothetical protein [Paenibacillus sp.]|uniref:hypothetical protein n=1 Tax=Paenibacillus sp. TaxID=58172 RepID=UPI002810BF75|nr:hypothetical protein [Paenibacillus sp.]